tara:strand:- start:17059 stop:17412 length:354 start_codon:yes stop_codon:yes gene_type:complete
MPTVTVNGKKKTFPYNAVGKAQADAYARLHGGKKKNNPGPKSEVKSSKNKSKLDKDIEENKNKKKDTKFADQIYRKSKVDKSLEKEGYHTAKGIRGTKKSKYHETGMGNMSGTSMFS